MPDKPKPIFVTAPTLAPLDEYAEILKSAWESGILTHNGPLVQRLEKELKHHLQVKNLVAVTNGTIAMQMAIRALNVTGEIITTPFTWIATASAIRWERCTPVFVDIDPETLNIDPTKIAEKITDQTTAILPVHVFSNPCDVAAIEAIATKHQLKVIYDGAHAMDVEYEGRNLLEYGDISCVSFHATKLFNTGEGGACVTLDDGLDASLKRIRFFGYNEEKQVVDDGFNGKMTEVHAALGLANLKYLSESKRKRREIFDQYHANLSDLDYIRFQKIIPDSYNYSYMPIIFDSEKRLLAVFNRLLENKIMARRYFYPSLTEIQCLHRHDSTPISDSIAATILCLPSFNELTTNKIDEICSIIRTG